MAGANDSFAQRLRRIEPPAGAIALFWMGQASFALKGAGLTILIDPYLSEHPDRLVPPVDHPEAFDFVDLLLITHEHLDHLDGPACRLIAQRAHGARIIVPAPIVEQVTALGVDAERVLGVQPGGPVTVGAARVWPVPAMHGLHASDAYTFGREYSDGQYRFLGYVVELDGVQVYHAGDTVMFDGLIEAVRALAPQVALLPINGRDYFREEQDIVGNLNAREAARLAVEIGAEVLVPMHYDLFPANLEDPGVFVSYARRHFPHLHVLLLGHFQPFVYTPLLRGRSDAS